MNIITYRGKPVTLNRIYEIESATGNASYQFLTDREKKSYIAFASRKLCIAEYIYCIGWTWKERAKGIECEQILNPRT